MLVMRPAQGPRSKTTLIHTHRNLKQLATQTIRTDVQNGRHIQRLPNVKRPLVHLDTTTQLSARRPPEVDQATIRTHRPLAETCPEAQDTATHTSEFKENSNEP